MAAKKPNYFVRFVIGSTLTIALLLSATLFVATTGEMPTDSEGSSIQNRMAHWAAGWLIDRTISEPQPLRRRFISGPPIQDPSCLVRDVSSDGIPVINHAKGW